MENSIQADFANHLGRKICFKYGTTEQNELILLELNLSNIIGKNSNDFNISASYAECKLIFENKDELVESGAPTNICILRTPDGFVSAEKVLEKDWTQVKDELEKICCSCVGITLEEFKENKKIRKKEFVWSRQLLMSTIRQMHPKLSLAKVGGLYGKDHATVLNAIEKTRDLSETDKYWRELFEGALIYIKNTYGAAKANQIFSVKHLNR